MNYQPAIISSQALRALAFSLAVVLTLTTRLAPAVADIFPEDLIAYWQLDGNLNDSADGNHGQLAGDLPPFVTGVDGTALGALDLSAVANHVNTGLSLAGGAKTMLLWAKSTATGTATIWAGNEGGSGDRFYLGGQTGASEMWAAGGNTGNNFTANANPSDGDFHHYALVDDGSNNILVYQDGNVNPIANFGYAGTSATAAGRDFQIGAAGGGGDVPANSIIDDVALFNRVLASEEIQSVFNATTVDAVPELIPDHYWPLNGNLNDVAGGNNGSFQDAPPPAPGYVAGASGMALDFRGGANHVRTPAQLGDGPKSMSLWVKSEAEGTESIWAGNAAPTSQRFYVGALTDNRSLFVGAGGTIPDPGVVAFPGIGFVDTGLQLGAGPKTMLLFAKSTAAGTNTIWAGNQGNEVGDPSHSQRFYVGGREEPSSVWAGGATTVDVFGSPADPYDGDFHHYALVDDGAGTLTVFQDGNTTPIHTLNYNGSTATQIDAAMRDFQIGRAGGGDQVSANAVLDDVALFNRMLTPEEIAGVFAAGSVDAIPELLPDNYWKLDGDFTDSAGSNDGVFTVGSTALFGEGADGTADGALDLTARNLPGPHDGEFHHYVVVDDGAGIMTVHIDGSATPAGTFTYSGSTATQSVFEIGQAGGGGSVPANAIVDDVALFNRMLTVDEIGAIFQAGSVAGAIIPEPGSCSLLLLGFGFFAARMRRRVGAR